MHPLSLQLLNIPPVDWGESLGKWEFGYRAGKRGFRTDKVAKSVQRTPLLDLTDFKRDLSELTDRLGNAQDCL